MDATGFEILVEFFGQVDVLMLIFVRVLAFCLILPVISSQNMFGIARIFLALVVAVALFMSGTVTVVTYADNPVGYVAVILQEFLVGMMMGYVVFMVYNLIYFAGQMLDFQIGLAMVNVLDPMTQIQVPLVGNLFYLAILAMTVVSGGIQVFFGGLMYSYQVLPIGTAMVLGNEAIAQYVLLVLNDSFFVAVRVATPIVGAVLVIDAALGIMIRTVPQMNMFVVGIPIKMLAGFLLLGVVLVPALGGIYDFVFNTAANALEEIIWGLRGP